MSRASDATRTFRIANIEEVRSLSHEGKLRLVRERMLNALDVRVKRCKAHAAGLQIDMEVVGERLMTAGHAADIGSVKVAGYHIAQTELQVLVKAYNMILAIIGGEDAVVDQPGEEHEDD